MWDGDGSGGIGDQHAKASHIWVWRVQAGCAWRALVVNASTVRWVAVGGGAAGVCALLLAQRSLLGEGVHQEAVELLPGALVQRHVPAKRFGSQWFAREGNISQVRNQVRQRTPAVPPSCSQRHRQGCLGACGIPCHLAGGMGHADAVMPCMRQTAPPPIPPPAPLTLPGRRRRCPFATCSGASRRAARPADLRQCSAR